MTATKRMHIASRDTKALRPKWVQTAKSVKIEIAEVRFVQQCLCVCVGGGVVVAVCGFFYKKCRAKLDACHGNGQG